MFGVWQAGAWSVLCGSVTPELVVGVSAGCLNGYLIASGASAGDLRRYWLDGRRARLRGLHTNIREMMQHYRPRIPFAVTVTDPLRRTLRIFRDSEITWRHLAASCALPGVLPPQRLEGRWYFDGGLLDPVPVRAAAELGATAIVALNVLPGLRSRVLAPLARSLRRAAGYRGGAPDGARVYMLAPSRMLGGMRAALAWKRERVEGWWELGAEDAGSWAKNISL